MKNPSLGGLIYYEYYLGRKHIRNNLLITLAIAALILLFMTSFEYGNLRLLDEGAREALFPIFFVYGKYLPVFGFCFLASSMSEVFLKQECAKWQSFRIAVPVSGFRLAAARYLFMAGLGLFGVLLSAIYFWLFAYFFPSEIGKGAFGILFLCMAFTSVMDVLMQIYGILFHSADKAGLAVSATMMIPVFLFAFLKMDNMDELSQAAEVADVLKSAENFAAGAIPYSIMILVLSYLLGLIATGFLFKRREK